MKRWLMVLMASAAVSMWAGAQDVWVRPYFFADDPFSNFAASFANGCLTISDGSFDCQHDACPNGNDCSCGWANRHVWFITLDGISPAVFDPDSNGSTLELEVTIAINPNMQASRTIETGIFVVERPFPRYPSSINNQCGWWADGQFMVANENGGGSGGEIAAFGGRLPFWNGSGVRYTGGSVTIVFRYDGSQKKVQYAIKNASGNEIANSGWLTPGDAASNYNCGPHGLRFFSIGGYVQFNNIGSGTNPGGSVQFCNIKLNGKTVLGQSVGDVNLDGRVDDADLLTVLFNFGAGG
ncbi:hypothetical protein HRbin15_01960 [bacterium HR15]|nr:hypothetical protein HRbin15_01960 [bacterium HR15]